MSSQALDIPLLMLEYLESKSLFGAERALRTELALAQQENADPTRAQAQNLFTSQLERLLKVPSKSIEKPSEQSIEDFTLPEQQQIEVTDVEDSDVPGSSVLINLLQPEGKRHACTRQSLVSMAIFASGNDERTLRSWHGRGSPQTRVVFHDPSSMTEAQGARSQCDVLRLCLA